MCQQGPEWQTPYIGENQAEAKCLCIHHLCQVIDLKYMLYQNTEGVGPTAKLYDS